MRVCVSVVATFCFLLVATSPGIAGVRVEKLEENIFFLEAQTGRLLQGGLLTDTVKKQEAKITKELPLLCQREGKPYYKIAEMSEIVRDDLLRNYWMMLTGGEAVKSEAVEYDGNSAGKKNIVRRLVLLSDEEGAGFKKCPGVLTAAAKAEESADELTVAYRSSLEKCAALFKPSSSDKVDCDRAARACRSEAQSAAELSVCFEASRPQRKGD